MKNGSEIYNLLIDLRQWIALGKPVSEEKRYCDKLDRLIFELGKIDQPPTDDQQAVDEGVASANRTFEKFLKNSEG